MFNEKIKLIFNEYTPAIDALLSVTILSIITIAALSVPAPDSYMQDVNINTMTVQARQVAVPLTIALHPDLGVSYEVGKAGLTPSQVVQHQNQFEQTISGLDKDFIQNDLEMGPNAVRAYNFYLTMDGRRGPPQSLQTAPGTSGVAWINHPTCDPNEPLSYITVKH